jgi:parvulin-like peptidyl-prolyl isomerase
MRMKLAVPILVLALAGAAGRASAEDAPAKKKIAVERVAAVVNDSIILESEVVQRAAPDMSALDSVEDPRQRQRQWQKILQTTADEMIAEELMQQAAEENKLEVSAEEVEKAIADVKRTNKLTDKQLEQALAAQGFSIPEYKKDLRKQILRLRAQNVLVRPRVAITDDEVKAQYEKIAGTSASTVEVKLRHILIALPDDASEDAQKEARRKAGDLVSRARAGEDFAKLAASSDDADSKQKGGEIGWYKRGDLPAEWEEALFTMNAGEIRGPLRGPRGMHVFQVMETKKDPVKGFDEVKEELRNQLYGEELEKQTKVWLEELRKKAHVEVKI